MGGCGRIADFFRAGGAGNLHEILQNAVGL
jgi:hypothetical protein